MECHATATVDGHLACPGEALRYNYARGCPRSRMKGSIKARRRDTVRRYTTQEQHSNFSSNEECRAISLVDLKFSVPLSDAPFLETNLSAGQRLFTTPMRHSTRQWHENTEALRLIKGTMMSEIMQSSFPSNCYPLIAWCTALSFILQLPFLSQTPVTHYHYSFTIS